MKHHIKTLAFTLLIVCVLSSSASAKRIRVFPRGLLPGSVSSPGDMQGSISLPYDSGTGRKLLKVKDLLKKKKYAQAANFLGKMLERTAGKDSFLKISARQQSLASLNSKIREMIHALPTDGREEYERRFGPTAQHLVEEAERTGSITFLEETIVKYLHTQAGYLALYRLGSHYQDRGLPLEAAFCFSRLVSYGEEANKKFQPHLSLRLAVCWDNAGKADNATKTLLQLQKKFPETTFSIAGKKVKLFQNNQKPLSWLTTHVGAPSLMNYAMLHNWSHSHTAGVKPIFPVKDIPLMSPRWSHLLMESGSTLLELDRTVEMKVNQDIAPIMPYEPLVIGERLFMRTGNGFKVFNLADGKPLWSYPSSEQKDIHYTKADWSNYARSTLTTDGESIFMVEDISLSLRASNVKGLAAPVAFNGRWGGNIGLIRGGPFGGPVGVAEDSSGTVIASGSSNSLTSRDIRGNRQGNLKWIVGGETGGFEPRLAGAFFLGSPLYYGGRLFVIFEQNRNIKLGVIDPRQGRLLWSLELAQVQHAISSDPFRKRAGASPTIVDGIILCPTSGGGMVAVDLTMHSLLWAYRYTRSYESRPQSGYRNNRRGQVKSHWANSSLMVADGKVILAPMESSELHCVELKTGKALWKQPRGNKLYVAGLYKKNLVIVWATGLSVIKIDSGLPGWKKTIVFKKGVLPSGRGILTSKHFYLPMTDATIAQVDLSAGKIVHTLASSRGRTFGNLIWHRGMFISQGLQYLEVLDELETMVTRVTAALEKNPNDVTALLQMSQVDQNKGETALAIKRLQKAYQLSRHTKIRARLIAALLDGVRKKLPLSKEYSNLLDRFAVE